MRGAESTESSAGRLSFKLNALASKHWRGVPRGKPASAGGLKSAPRVRCGITSTFLESGWKTPHSPPGALTRGPATPCVTPHSPPRKSLASECCFET